MNALIPVSARLSPFHPQRITRFYGAGVSIADMIASFPELSDEVFAQYGIVHINDQIVPRHMWRVVKVRPDARRPVAITFHQLPMHGGAKGGKSTLQLVGTIALIAATAWIGGGGIAAAFSLGASSTFAAGGLGATLAAAGVGLGGQLAVGLLTAPPTLPSNKAIFDSPLNNTQAAAGITGNVLRPLQPIPRVLGEMRVSPPHLIRPYSKMDSGNNGKVSWYACVGLAGKIDITEIRVNGVDSATFDTDLFSSHSSETGGAQTLATENVFEDFPGETLSRHVLDESTAGGQTLLAASDVNIPKYHYYRTNGIPDFVRIRLAFPSGIFGYTAAGATARSLIPIRLELRRVGDVSWINLPEMWFSDDNVKAGRLLRHQIVLSWGTNNTSIFAPSAGPMLQMAYAIAATGQAHEYDAHSDFLHSGVSARRMTRTDDYITTIHLSTSTFPQDAEYEVRLKRGAGFQPGGTLTTTYPTAGGGAADSNWFGRATGSVGVTEDQFLKPCEVGVESFATVRDGLPLDPTDLSYVEIKVRDLQVDSISFLATSKADTWNGSVWTATGNNNTQNPAALFRHILKETTLNANPVEDSLLEDADNQSLTDWYDYCTSNSLECNYVCEGMSVEEILRIVCACGHASLRLTGSGVGVVLEKDRTAESPVQIFGPQNSNNHSMRRNFPDPPLDALFVTYLDETDDFKPKERTVTFGGGSNIQAAEFPGVTLAARVDEVGDIALRQAAYRVNTYQFEVGQEALVSQRGDLVGLSVDFLRSGSRDSAWVNGPRLNSAGDVIGVTLDREVDLTGISLDIFSLADLFDPADIFAANSVGILIRLHDGTILQKQVNLSGVTVPTRVITFTSTAGYTGIGQDAADALFKAASCAVGILDSEVRRCIVGDIEWQENWSARLTLVDEAPLIWA